MIIKKATEKNLDACAKIVSGVFGRQGEKWTLKNAKARLKDFLFLEKHGRGANFCIVENKKIVGLLFAEILNYNEGKILWLGEFAVLPEFQNRGLGSEAMAFLERTAKKMKIVSIELATDKKQLAIKKYKKMGFKDTGFVLLQKKIK